MPLKEIKKICCQFEWWNRDLILLKINPVRGWVKSRPWTPAIMDFRFMLMILCMRMHIIFWPPLPNENPGSAPVWKYWVVWSLEAHLHSCIYLMYCSGYSWALKKDNEININQAPFTWCQKFSLMSYEDDMIQYVMSDWSNMWGFMPDIPIFHTICIVSGSVNRSPERFELSWNSACC